MWDLLLCQNAFSRHEHLHTLPLLTHSASPTEMSSIHITLSIFQDSGPSTEILWVIFGLYSCPWLFHVDFYLTEIFFLIFVFFFSAAYSFRRLLVLWYISYLVQTMTVWIPPSLFGCPLLLSLAWLLSLGFYVLCWVKMFKVVIYIFFHKKKNNFSNYLQDQRSEILPNIWFTEFRLDET